MKDILFIKVHLSIGKSTCVSAYTSIFRRHILQVVSLHLYKNKRSYLYPESLAQNVIIIRNHAFLLSIYPSIYLFTYLDIFGSTALCCALEIFTVSWSLTQSVGLSRRGISPSQSSYLHIAQHKHRINAHVHPCLTWDSNPGSQCLSGRKQYMSYIP
jgi:hypothetical protein